MTEPTTDVIVVGAGPAGGRTARLLAERGHGVALADENAAPRDEVVCTGIVGEEPFRELDLDPGAVVDEIRCATFRSPGGVEVRYEPPAPLARVVDRTAFDARLAEEARAAGARVLREHAARSVERDASGVTVGFETPDGDRRLRARALVVATGHQRWLHEAAGLGTPDGYVHGVHADLPFTDLDAAELYFGNGVAPGFFAWAVPFGDGTARLGVLAPQGARRLFHRLLRRPYVRERLGVDPEGDGGAIRRALRSRGIVQGAVVPSHADRVLAVGEAAGQVKTTTAGGIYYGMLGAEMAADVLDGGLAEDRLSAEALAAYDEAWHGRLGREIEAGRELQRAAAALTDEEIDRLFTALQDGLGAAVRAAVRFDWHWPALRVLFRKGGLRRKLARGGSGGPGRAEPALSAAG